MIHLCEAPTILALDAICRAAMTAEGAMPIKIKRSRVWFARPAKEDRWDREVRKVKEER